MPDLGPTGIDLLWLPSLPAGSFALPSGSAPRFYRGRFWRHAPGGYTDGMSDPKWLQMFPGWEPFGWHFPDDCLHDAGYHGALQIRREAGVWELFDISRDEMDLMYRDLLIETAGMDVEKLRQVPLIYEAVHLGGAQAYVDGHAKPGILVMDS